MPGSAFLRFTEPDEYQARIRPAEVQIIPTECGHFSALLSQIDLHHLTLQHGWQTLPTVIRTALHPSRGSIMFTASAAGPAIKVDSSELTPDALVLGAPGEEHFLQTHADTAWSTLTLTPATYAEARATLVGDDVARALQTSVVLPPPAAMDRLRAFHHRVMGLIAAPGDGGIHPEVAKAAEQGLLAAVVDCFATDALVTVPRLGSRNSTAVMRRLYDVLDEGEGQPLYLMDVCTRLGVSGRTLRAACAEHLGLGPHRFLWLRRMQLARQALIKADPRIATVTNIATAFGFWELGRFSVQYKWLFGEPPSATLGRRRV